MSFNNTTTPSHDCVRVDIFPLFVFAFVVNVFALIAVSKAKPRGRAYNATRQIHMLIFCLSLSDTTSVALQCIMPVTSFINCGWFGGKASCNVFGYISAVLVVWSAWIVVYLSFQRFLVTVYPFRYRDYFTTTKISYLLISGFIVQCGFFTPPFLGVGEFVYYETGQFCSLSLTPTGKTDTIYLGTLVAQGFLCVTLTIICNISVLISLRSRKSIFSGLTLYSLQSSTSTFMSLTKAVALMFCVCYIPFLIRMAVDLCKQTSFEELGLQHTITMALLFVNTLANPFIYVACRKRYRHSLKQICFGCCSRLKRIAPAPEHSVFVLNYVRKTSQQTKNERKTTASL